MKIEILSQNDCRDAALLHKNALPDTVSSRIGVAYLVRLYETVANSPGIHLGYVMKEKGRVIGVITVSHDLKKSQHLMKHSLFPLDIILAIIQQPIVFMKHLVTQRMLLLNIRSPYVTILTICVDPAYRRKGIGKMLVKTVFRVLAKERIAGIFVDTGVSNITAQTFYKALGFRPVRKILDATVYEKKIYHSLSSRLGGNRRDNRPV